MRSVGLALVMAACSSSTVAPTEPAPSPAEPSTMPTALPSPPASLVTGWRLSPRHAKYVAVGELPVLGSATVSDAALREAAHLIEQMIGHRRDVLRRLAQNHVRFVVMATTELTTDVPEHADLTPKDYWDRRARGLGATRERPAVSCGEENLLDLEGDPYSSENILTHEFAHAIHQMAVSELDTTFDRRLREAYAAAQAAGRWAGTYAMENPFEYWAEGAQSWFDTNRANDDQHGPIATRKQLVTYDPPLAKLLTEVFGDRPWRYRKVADRDEAGRAHLAGWDRTTAPTFAWPERIAKLSLTKPGGLELALSSTPIDRSPQEATTATNLTIVNRRARAISVDWIDFAGKPVTYRTLAPSAGMVQATYVGHVWRISEGAQVLGYASAPAGDAHIEVR